MSRTSLNESEAAPSPATDVVSRMEYLDVGTGMSGSVVETLPVSVTARSTSVALFSDDFLSILQVN